MTRLLTLLLVAVPVIPSMATDSRIGEQSTHQSGFEFLGLPLLEAEVLICLDTDANPGFADPTPLYYSAFEAAGASQIATCAVEVSGGTIEFPPNLTSNNYAVVVLLTSENWWSTPQNVDPSDEAALAGYLDSGGNLLVVGQDYMYGAHPSMGSCSGFPRNYLGLSHCYQDVLWGPNTAGISGCQNSIFEGESAHLDSANVFLSNPFFPDCADPTPSAQRGFLLDGVSDGGVVICHETDTFKTVWAGIELSAAAPKEFSTIIRKVYDWFLGTTPVDNASWGRIKSLYDR
jgi:hypothetical protein